MPGDAGPRERRTKARQIPGEAYLRQRPGSLHWQISFRIENYRFRASSGTSDRIEAAKLAEAEWKRVWNEVKLGAIAPGQISLNDAFARYFTEVSQHTNYGMRGQRYHMAVLLRALDRNALLSSLDDSRINDLVQWLRNRAATKGRPEQLSPSTINRYLTTLSVICKHAAKKWGMAVGTWSKAEHSMSEPEGREVFLTHDQAHALIAAATPHLRHILLMEFMTGLRKTNVVELDWGTISLDLGRAILVQKGNRRLTISLPPPAIDLLEQLQPDKAKRAGAVFWFGNPAVGCGCPRCKNERYSGEPIRSVKRTFATAIREASLTDLPAGRLRFHDLRHTFASFLLAECSDLRIVQETLGHKHISTTARYAHLLPGRKEAAVNASAAKLMSSAPAASGHKSSTVDGAPVEKRSKIKRVV